MIPTGEMIMPSMIGIEKNRMIKCRKIKFNPYLIPLTKIDPKQIKGLNIRPDIINLPEENRKKAF